MYAGGHHVQTDTMDSLSHPDRPLRLLVIEDSPADFLLLEHFLRQHYPAATCWRIDDDAALDEAMKRGAWDAVIADYHVPGMDFQASLQRIQASHPDLPVILLSGRIGEERAVDMLTAGVRDFVLKDRICRLAPVLKRCIDEAETRQAHSAAEAALAKSEAQYRAIVETAADGFWMLDEEGRLLTVNEAYVRRSGYSRAELLGMRISDLEADESPAQVRAHIEKVRRNGSDLFETRHITKSGEVWPAEVNASFWPEAGGRFFGFLRDLGERKRAEAALQTWNDEMERLMRFHVARQTIAAIAHELNQPLVAISSYTEAALRLLRAGNPQPDRLLHALEQSAAQAQRAGGVARELLTYLSQEEAGTEPVDLNALVCKVMGAIELDHHGEFSIRLDLDPALPTVGAHRLQIEKVLANLVENGIEAMREAAAGKGRIVIAVRTHADGDMAEVAVCDSGPGIDAAILHRIFDPFFTTRKRGLGMGLPISRAIVESHGGRLWVEPNPGGGACFRFLLPFAA